MRGIAILLFILSVCAIVKIIDLKQNERLILNASNELKKESDSLCIEHSERLITYYLITIEQNNIIDGFRSSRIAKSKNEKLTKLMQKL